MLQKIEDGDFPALRPNYDRRSDAHHTVTGHNTPPKSLPDFVTASLTQHNSLPQQNTQPQNTATYISHDNTLPKNEQTQERQNSASS